MLTILKWAKKKTVVRWGRKYKERPVKVMIRAVVLSPAGQRMSSQTRTSFSLKTLPVQWLLPSFILPVWLNSSEGFGLESFKPPPQINTFLEFS